MKDIKDYRKVIGFILVFYAITVIGMYFNKIETVEHVRQQYQDSLTTEQVSHNADCIDWHNAELKYQERLNECK
jgi:hypothetical protein